MQWYENNGRKELGTLKDTKDIFTWVLVFYSKFQNSTENCFLMRLSNRVFQDYFSCKCNIYTWMKTNTSGHFKASLGWWFQLLLSLFYWTWSIAPSPFTFSCFRFSYTQFIQIFILEIHPSTFETSAYMITNHTYNQSNPHNSNPSNQCFIYSTRWINFCLCYIS